MWEFIAIHQKSNKFRQSKKKKIIFFWYHINKNIILNSHKNTVTWTCSHSTGRNIMTKLLKSNSFICLQALKHL